MFLKIGDTQIKLELVNSIQFEDAVRRIFVLTQDGKSSGGHPQWFSFSSQEEYNTEKERILKILAAPIPPGPGAEDQGGTKSHLAKAQEYQKEHKCSIVAALIATAASNLQRHSIAG